MANKDRILLRAALDEKISPPPSDSTLDKWIKRGLFPRPARIGGGKARGWLESDVDAWIESQMAGRDAKK